MNIHYNDPINREMCYLDFRDPAQLQRVASTRVVSEYPIITVDMDEFGEVIGVRVEKPIKPPEQPNTLENITRI